MKRIDLNPSPAENDESARQRLLDKGANDEPDIDFGDYESNYNCNVNVSVDEAQVRRLASFVHKSNDKELQVMDALIKMAAEESDRHR